MTPPSACTAGLWSGGHPLRPARRPAADEALSLLYTSPPLEQDVHVVGRPRAELHVASTATVIGFAVSLSDVAPDGTSHLVAKGMLNATRRRSLTDPEPLAPGEIYGLAIEIDTTGWVFAAATGSASRSRTPTGRTSGRRRSRQRTPSTAATSAPPVLSCPQRHPLGAPPRPSSCRRPRRSSVTPTGPTRQPGRSCTTS